MRDGQTGGPPVAGVSLVLLSAVLTVFGSASFLYLANNTRSSSDLFDAFQSFAMVTGGGGAGIVGFCLARRHGIDHRAGNVLGMVFAVTSLAMLLFGFVTLHSGRSVAKGLPLPPNLPVPAFVGILAVLCGLEIAFTLKWIIQSGRRKKRLQTPLPKTSPEQ